MRKSNDPDVNPVVHMEIQAADDALARGDLIAAQKHLDLAIQHRAPHGQTKRLSMEIQTATQAQLRRAKGGGRRGFGVAVLGYLLVSLQQPLGWGIPLWCFLAFLLVPGIVGVVVGLQQRTIGAPGRSFWSAFKSTGWVTAFYTIMHLLLLGGSHSDASDKMQERLAGVIATVTYAVVAGLVAGATSATIVSMRVKERQV